MPTENATSKTAQKFRWKKWLIGLIVIVLLIFFFAVPAYLSSGTGQNMIRDKINASVQGKTDFKSLTIGWFKGVKITEFSFLDKENGISVDAKKIQTKPKYLSLLSSQPALGKTVIDDPVVTIDIAGTKTTTAADEPATKTKSDKKVAPVLPLERIDLSINNGNVIFNLGSSDPVEPNTLQLTKINTKLNLRPPGGKTDFDLNMVVKDDHKESAISATGNVKTSAKKPWTLESMTSEFQIEVNDLDLSTLQSLFAAFKTPIDASGVISANITTAIKDGQLLSLDADVKGKEIFVTADMLKGDTFKTRDLVANIKLQSKEDLLNIDNLKIETDYLSATANGVIPKTVKSLSDFAKPDSAHDLKAQFDCDLAKAMTQMPHTFGLKDGAKVTLGRLSGNIETAASQNKRQITANAKLWALEGQFPIKQIILSKPITLDAELISDKKGINIDTLKLDSFFASANCTGSTKSLKYSANLDLAKMQQELGAFVELAKFKMTGKVSTSGTASVTKKLFSTTASADLTDIVLTDPNGSRAFEPSAQIYYQADALMDKSLLEIKTFTLSATSAKLSTQNATIPLNEKATQSLNLPIWLKADLANLHPFAVVLISLPTEMQLAGQIESRSSITKRNGRYRVFTDATTIDNLKVNYPDQKPFAQDKVDLILDMSATPAQKTFSINRLEVTSPQIKIRQGSLEKKTESQNVTLRGNFDLEYDFAGISTLTAPYLPKGLQITGKRKDKINFSTSYPEAQPDKMLANLNTSADFGFSSAEYMGLEFGPVETKLKIQQGLMTLEPFAATVNNGSFNFAANADFNRKPALLKTPAQMDIIKDVQINDRMGKKLLMYVNPIFANAGNVTGVANFNCETLAIPLAEGAGNDLEVVGTISMQDVKLQASGLLNQILTATNTQAGADITIHPTRFELKNDILEYKNDMQIDIGRTPIIFSGSIGPNDRLDKMSVILPYSLTGSKTANRVSLPLEGTLSNPKLDTAKLIEEGAKDLLEEELRKGLEKIFR